MKSNKLPSIKVNLLRSKFFGFFFFRSVFLSPNLNSTFFRFYFREMKTGWYFRDRWSLQLVWDMVVVVWCISGVGREGGWFKRFIWGAGCNDIEDMMVHRLCCVWGWWGLQKLKVRAWWVLKRCVSMLRVTASCIFIRWVLKKCVSMLRVTASSFLNIWSVGHHEVTIWLPFKVYSI